MIGGQRLKGGCKHNEVNANDDWTRTTLNHDETPVAFLIMTVSVSNSMVWVGHAAFSASELLMKRVCCVKRTEVYVNCRVAVF